MPDAYTTQSSIGTLSQNVWSKALVWPYRDENVFDSVATARSTTENGTRGKGVTHTFINDLPISTVPIDELVGPDAITFSTSTKTFGLNEYAVTMKSSLLARATGYIDLDAAMANLIGQNAGATMDTIAANSLADSANVQAEAGTFTSESLEIAYTELDAMNIPKINGNYVVFAHPYQIHDFRLEAGPATWREPQENGSDSSAALKNRTTGVWAGFQIVSSNRLAPVGGTYKAVAIGADALAKSYSDHPEAPGATPKVVFGLPTDALKRNHPVSWYHLVGYNTLREASVRVITTTATLG